jgi:hypothetical protein
VLAGLVIGAIVGAGPARAQTRSLSVVRTLAVAPFSDPNPTTRAIVEMTDAQVSEQLKGGRFQIIDAVRVTEAMTRLALTPADLISPNKTVELGRALGADAVLTGRVVEIFGERGFGAGRGPEARIVVDVRVLDVNSRLKLFEQEVRFSDYGGSFAAAARGFAVDVAALLTR